jgi:predicted transcriptional regulator
MATLQQQIAGKFLAKLAESKKVDADKIDQLRALLADSKKLKAEEFVEVFSLPAGGDLK